VHGYLDVIVCQLRGRGGIVILSLLLLLLLRPLSFLLGVSSPGSWPDLILVLPKCVVEPSWVGDPLPGSVEFDHLSSFHDVDSLDLVFVVILREWVPDDLF
jgi:hypothetical protein